MVYDFRQYSPRQYNFYYFFAARNNVADARTSEVGTPQPSLNLRSLHWHISSVSGSSFCRMYRGADIVLSLTRKETSYSDQTLTFASHSKTIPKVVRPTRSPRQQWPLRRTKNFDIVIVFFSRVGLRTYQHSCKERSCQTLWNFILVSGFAVKNDRPFELGVWNFI